jgi:hypothetical protein
MYFFKHKGKQFVDFRGNLILSHNPVLVRARSRNNAPRYAKNAHYVPDIPKLNFFRKIQALWLAFRFIFGKSQRIDTEIIDKENDLK